MMKEGVPLEQAVPSPLNPEPLFNRHSLTRLLLPLVLEQLLAIAIGMADTMMVANVGESAVSAISLVDSINMLLINVFSALATGGAVVTAQYLGRGDRANACDTAKQLMLAILIVSVLLMAIALLGNGPILRLIYGQLDADVMSQSRTYFYLTALSFPFLALFSGCSALFRSMSNSRVTLLISIVMNMLNIGGNAILIYGCRWGVAGAATATLVSRIVGAVISLALLFNHRYPIYLREPTKWKLQPAMLKSILRIGVPNGLENGVFQIGKIIVSSIVAGFGTAAIAANAVAGSASLFPYISGSAVGLGLITVVGQCMGAGRPEEAARYTKQLMGVVFLTMGLMNVLLFIFAPQLAHLYGLGAESTVLAVQVMRWDALFAATIWPIAFVLPNALRASGDVKFTMWVSIISMWICRVGLSYLLSWIFGAQIIVVWAAMWTDWVVRCAFFVPRFLSGRWKKQKVIE